MGLFFRSQPADHFDAQDERLREQRSALKKAAMRAATKGGQKAGSIQRNLGETPTAVREELDASITAVAEEQAAFYRDQHAAFEHDCVMVVAEKEAVEAGQRDADIDASIEGFTAEQDAERDNLDHSIVEAETHAANTGERMQATYEEQMDAREKHDGQRQRRLWYHAPWVAVTVFFLVFAFDIVPLAMAINTNPGFDIPTDSMGWFIAAVYGFVLAFLAHACGSSFGREQKLMAWGSLAFSAALLGLAASWRPDALLFTAVMVGTWIIASVVAYRRDYSIESIEADERYERCVDENQRAVNHHKELVAKRDGIDERQARKLKNARQVAKKRMLQKLETGAKELEKAARRAKDAGQEAALNLKGLRSTVLARYETERERARGARNRWNSGGKAAAALVAICFVLGSCAKPSTNQVYLVTDVTASSEEVPELTTVDVMQSLGVIEEHGIDFKLYSIDDTSFPREYSCVLEPNKPVLTRSTLERAEAVKQFEDCIGLLIDDANVERAAGGKDATYAYRALQTVFEDAVHHPGARVYVMSDLVDFTPEVRLKHIEGLGQLDHKQREELASKMGAPLPDLSGLQVVLVYAGKAEGQTDEIAYRAHAFYARLLTDKGAVVTRRSTLPAWKGNTSVTASIPMR